MKEVIDDIFYRKYMQKPISLLTKENLKELEEHCRRLTQRYGTERKVKEEHLIVLELLYTYQLIQDKAIKIKNKLEYIENMLIETTRGNIQKYTPGELMFMKNVYEELLNI